MVFNATFNNISVLSWRSVLLVEEAGAGPSEQHYRPPGKPVHWGPYQQQLTGIQM